MGGAGILRVQSFRGYEDVFEAEVLVYRFHCRIATKLLSQAFSCIYSTQSYTQTTHNKRRCTQSNLPKPSGHSYSFIVAVTSGDLQIVITDSMSTASPTIFSAEITTKSSRRLGVIVARTASYSMLTPCTQLRRVT